MLLLTVRLVALARLQDEQPQCCAQHLPATVSGSAGSSALAMPGQFVPTQVKITETLVTSLGNLCNHRCAEQAGTGWGVRSQK